MGIVKIYGTDQLAFRLALDAGARTTAGQRITTFLNQSGREYDVVVLSAGQTYGQMMTNDDPDGEEVQKAKAVYAGYTGTRTIARPTVFWGPDYDFEYFGDVDGIAMQADGSVVTKSMAALRGGEVFYQYKKGSITVKVPVVRYTKGKMPAWMVLYHELGHVKQYFAPGLNNAKNASQLDALWSQRLRDTDAIEAENLSEHENPICAEFGLSIRKHYKHMGNGMYRIAEAYVDSKAPALRVANDRADRIAKDRELLASANGAAALAGFFTK